MNPPILSSSMGEQLDIGLFNLSMAIGRGEGRLRLENDLVLHPAVQNGWWPSRLG